MIANKQQSDYLIKKLGLNRMVEGLFNKNSSKDDVVNFLGKYKYDYYNIRDKSSPAGKFMYKLSKEEIIDNLDNYKDKFSIYESLAEADKRLILQGEIEISEDFIMTASLSDVKEIPNRVAMRDPKFNLYNYDLKEKREPSIKGLSKIIDYVVIKELLNVVVEFSLFEIPVGVNQENIIIWELRNY